MIAWLLKSDAPVAWVGTAESPGGKADVLEFKPADQAVIRLFLESASHLPLMITWQGIAPRIFVARRGGSGRGQTDQPTAETGRAPALEGGSLGPAGEQRSGGAASQVTFQMYLAEYRSVNGVKLPHLITRAMNGQTNEEWTITGYKVNPALKSNTFTK
jgi:hypothetical protein